MPDLYTDLHLEVDTSTPRNYCINPHAENGSTRGWALVNAVTTPGGSPMSSGPASAFILQANAVATLTYAPFPVVEGQRFDFSAKMFNDGTAGRDTIVTASFTDAQGQPVGYPLPAYGTKPPGDTSTATSFTVPAGATRAMIEVRAENQPGQIYMNRAMVAIREPGNTILTPWSEPTWTRLTGKAVNIITERGNDLDGVEDVLTPGMLTATIVDPTVDPAVSDTLTRGRPVRLRVTIGTSDVRVWTGTIETADTTYENDGRPVINLVATDAARDLLDTKVGAMSVVSLAADVARVALSVGVPSQVDGITPKGFGTTNGALDDSAAAADWLRRAANSYRAYGYVDQFNLVQARSIAALSSTSGVVNLWDTGGDLSPTGVDLAYGTRALVNALDVTRINVDEVEDDGAKVYGPYVATASDAKHGRVGAELEITTGSPSAIAAAILPVYATPKRFPTEIRLNALRDLAQALRIGLYTTPVRVKRSTTYDDTVRITKVRHEITARVGVNNGTWKTILTPRPLETATATPVANPVKGADTGPGDVIDAQPGPLARRTRTGTGQTISNSTDTTVDFNTATVSDVITWDAGNKRFVVPKDGRYSVYAQIAWAANAAGRRAVMVAVNGTTTAYSRIPGYTGANNVVSVTDHLKLAAGDVVSVLCSQSSGADLAIVAVPLETYAAITYQGA